MRALCMGMGSLGDPLPPAQGTECLCDEGVTKHHCVHPCVHITWGAEVTLHVSPCHCECGTSPTCVCVLQDFCALPLAIYLTLFRRRVNSLCSDAKLYCCQPINQGVSLLSGARGLQ